MTIWLHLDFSFSRGLMTYVFHSRTFFSVGTVNLEMMLCSTCMKQPLSFDGTTTAIIKSYILQLSRYVRHSVSCISTQKDPEPRALIRV